MCIPFSSVAIVDFKQVNVSWEVLFLICYSSLKCVISQMIVFFFVFFFWTKIQLGNSLSKTQIEIGGYR